MTTEGNPSLRSSGQVDGYLWPDGAVYNLNDVNPNKIPKVDVRTPDGPSRQYRGQGKRDH